MDVIGDSSATPAGWWVADAVFEDVQGQVTEVGPGCGVYGGSFGRWSFVSERSLLPGGHANLWAYGTPASLALVVFGAASPQPIPLTALGVSSPGCDLHLQPNGVAGTLLTLFDVPSQPALASRGGYGSVQIKLPNEQWILGARVSTQWFDLAQLATSNGLQWTVASSIPTLDMALVEGHPMDALGDVRVHLAHVLRFEHQAP